jgi:CubicO group peptidase (beta-lactamase class C family)
MTTAAAIEGFAAPGYERVRDAFAANFTRTDGLREIGAALCAYKNGECVVDLWGGHADPQRTRPWREDTLVNVWSTTKAITAVAVAMLVDRGRITYQQRVADVWPEFAQAGKRDITIAQVMCHRAGLSGYIAPTTTADLYDWNACCAKLAAQAPVFPPEGMSCYHASTFGVLAGEIVRRVTGKTIGMFVCDEIAGPLQAEFYLGLPDIYDALVADLQPPKAMPSFGANVPRPVLMASTNPALDVGATVTRGWRGAEIPALNGHANARGLARIFAPLAMDGAMKNVRLMSPATLAAMTTQAAKGVDMLIGFDPQWCMGVHLNGNGPYGRNPRTFGHAGWGGSIVCADPDAGLSIGYVCNMMGPGLQGDKRTAAIMAAF